MSATGMSENMVRLFQKMKSELDQQTATIKKNVTENIMRSTDEKLQPILEENKCLKTEIQKFNESNYSDSDPLCLEFRKPCRHSANSKSKFKCSDISMALVIKNRELLNKHTSKSNQGRYMSRFMAPFEPQRRNKIPSQGIAKKRKLSCSYFILSKKKKNKLICKKLFMAVFGIKDKRLTSINNTCFKGGIPKEIAEHLQVKRGLFYTIWNKEYNIGFSTPSSDVCNACTLWGNRIKIEKDQQKKQELMVQKRVHNLRAKAFYDFIREKPQNTKSLSCFDMPQVQALPKTPIQDSFYARQSGRGSTEISSALYDYLTKMNIASDIHTIRLFCDGCGGQNKNSIVLHTLMQWLYAKSPQNIREIKLYFPVRGHSFLPADRVFGRLEKQLRKVPVITTHEGYYEIYKNHGDLRLLNRDWKIFNVKELDKHLIKIERIQSLKRIFIKKICGINQNVKGCAVLGFLNYRFGEEKQSETLLKKGKRIPTELSVMEATTKPLNANKKNYVLALLVKQFGETWEEIDELKWFNNILHNDRRETYSKYKNRNPNSVSDSARSGKGTDDIYKPKVFWFDQMNSFIRPFVQQRPTQSNLILPTENSSDASIENSLQSEPNFECSTSQNSEDVTQIASKIDTPAIIKRKIEPQLSTSKSKKSIGDHEIGFMTSAIDKLNAISNRASQVATNNDDSYDHFGKYIASMLRSIGPPTAIRLQQNFMNEITNAMCPPEYVTDNSTAGRSSGRQSNLSTFSASNDDDYMTLFTDL
ncbi:unnamed protein product [Pieris macdunnoughi]|uniref:DUF7869 domain-containing protein n=1 Tax=Pieris macdunnoughi TaxID=345717 RepID=A0A821XNP0_9NEOP|nr:unnamed protein product [Pieris macdunnoughi]